MPNQDPTQNQSDTDLKAPAGAAPASFFPQDDLPPPPPDFQKVTEEKPASGSAAPADIDISSVIKPPKKKFGTGKIIATILGLFVLVGGVGAGIVLTQQQQLFQQKAASCGATCRTNCTEDETGQGQGSCPSGKISCVANSCNGVPDAGTTCVSAGFVCVSKGSCPAGHNQAGSCNTANTDCCDTASGNLPTGAQPASSCIFDNYQHRGCVLVNGTWSMCDKDPKGEIGYSSPDCKNDPTSSQDFGCGIDSPNCVPGGYCIGATVCTPSVAQYAHCTSDSSCLPTNPPGNPTSTPVTTPTATPAAPYCVAVKAYSSTWTALTSTDLSALTTGSVVNFCVSGAAPAGTFDQAQFTINGTELAVTTTHRTDSTDYCQIYTILSTDTTVNVTAKIHHSTLGWF